MNSVCKVKCNNEKCVQCKTNVECALAEYMEGVQLVHTNKLGNVEDKDVCTVVGVGQTLNEKDYTILRKVDEYDKDKVASVTRDIRDYVHNESITGMTREFSGKRKAYKDCINKCEVYEDRKAFIKIVDTGLIVKPYMQDSSREHVRSYKIVACKYLVMQDENDSYHEELRVLLDNEYTHQRWFRIDELVNKFYVPKISVKGAPETIRVTKTGIIKPIHIKCGGLELMIDNLYIYRSNANWVYPVAQWTKDECKCSDEMIDILDGEYGRQIGDIIEDCVDVHKKIAPYWCCKEKNDMVLGTEKKG